MDLTSSERVELTTATVEIKYLREDIKELQAQMEILKAFRWWVLGASASISAIINLALHFYVK